MYVVTEFDCPGASEERIAMDCFGQGLEHGWMLDGVISQSDRQNAELWRYREGISASGY